MPAPSDGLPAGLRVRALATTAAVRLGLWALPVETVRRWATAGARPGPRGPAPDAVGRAVDAAVGVVPRATCLTRALATQALLVRSGRASTLHLGVRKDEAGRFRSHAWLECERRVVSGAEGHEAFRPITAYAS